MNATNTETLRLAKLAAETTADAKAGKSFEAAFAKALELESLATAA